MAKFLDLFTIKEDARIDVIGKAAMEGRTVGFIVDAEGPDGNEKANRYIAKLAEKYPKVRVLARFPGPVTGTVSIKVGLESTQS